MKLKEVSPKVATRDLLKLRPLRSEIDTFKTNLLRLLGKIDEIEREENQKNYIRDFLLDTYYKGVNEINTKGSADLVIHNGNTNKDKVGVILETKRPGNKGEMLSIDKPNTKALHELVLYYMRERIDENNIDIKHVIATNIYEWFIIDAQYFEKFFATNKNFVKQYNEWKSHQKVTSDTSLFYNEIVKPYIDTIQDEIPVTHFDIRKYEKVLKDDDKANDKSLIALYKTQSPYHLLRKSANDSNTLNDKFYKELLYIIGLEEYKESGKTIIRRRQEKNSGSLIENAIHILNVEDVYRVKNFTQYGKDYEERIFNVALELVLTWINRILFLKLLEGQLVTYHKGNTGYRFLDSHMIHDYDELYKLFHQVLARKPEDRQEGVREKYKYVPYLNSSLFEISELEEQAIRINALDNKASLNLMANSVLRDKKQKHDTVNTLDYIFRFLDAYDFSSEGKDDIQEDSRTIINASVLGKVFEKINGYKDGSIYTPGIITMYMCKETIRKSVVQAFNKHYSWNCETINDVHNEIKDRAEANTIINNLKICDPSVGSGHYLVSALNEIIAIKAELGILVDKEGKRIKDYTIEVINDELVMTDEYGDPFIYNYNSKESQRIQKTLFHEKQAIIENCLFGVDINPNSVKICRLRLWIELLKNAYYKEEGNFTELETLPNIDINIKYGDSLISRYSLDADLARALKSVNHTIPEYKNAVNKFKNATDRAEKRELTTLINSIKYDFQSYFSAHDERRDKLSKARGELVKLQSDTLFDSKKADTENKKKIEALNKKIEKLEKEIEEIKNNVAYQNAFEWRFEFPEVLNDDGDFEGFDIIIGNPPYIQLQKLGAYADCLQDQGYSTFVRTGDIYCLFYEKGISLLKPNGYLCFITSNKWMRAAYGQALRKYFLEDCNPLQLIDFSGLQLFESATVDTNILLAQKSENENKIMSCILDNNKDSINNLSDYFLQHGAISTGFLPEKSWAILSPLENRIKSKIDEIGTPLKDWDLNINRGILTGFNEAFIIDGETRSALLELSPKSAEIIRPILRGKDIGRYKIDFANQWVIFVPWHFPLNNDMNIKGASKIAEQSFIQEYPEIYAHLYKYKKQLEQRNISETGIRYEWYALQRFGANYWKDFEKPKITWGNLGLKSQFAYTEESYVINAPSPFIATQNLFLLGVLNSKISDFYIKNLGVARSGGYIEYKPMFVEQIPIPNIQGRAIQQIHMLVKERTTLHLDNHISEIENEIERQIFELYNFSQIEVAFLSRF